MPRWYVLYIAICLPAFPGLIHATITELNNGSGRSTSSSLLLTSSLGGCAPGSMQSSGGLKLYVGITACSVAIADNIVTDAPPASTFPRFSGITSVVPNPFNPRTEVRFAISAAHAHQSAKVLVHDARGRRIATLVDEILDASHHRVTWNGTDSSGRPVASGVYLFSLEVAATRSTRRATLVR